MGHGTHPSAPSGYDGFGTLVRLNRLLDALQRLEQHYSERDATILRCLQTLTARVDALSAQVEQLARALQQLKTPGSG